MLLSLEDAVALLTKWKDESVSVLVLGQDSFRQGLRSVHERGVDWNMGFRGAVSQVSLCQNTTDSTIGRVVFESPSGSLSLSLESCAYSYDEACEWPAFINQDPRSAIASCLFIFFPTDEAFVVYQLQER